MMLARGDWFQQRCDQVRWSGFQIRHHHCCLPGSYSSLTLSQFLQLQVLISPNQPRFLPVKLIYDINIVYIYYGRAILTSFSRTFLRLSQKVCATLSLTSKIDFISLACDFNSLA